MTFSHPIPGVNPFNRNDWSGQFISTDGADATDFEEHDVLDVLASGETPDGWDGTCAAILLLKDGRYVTWETFWGPTGNGFCLDAYGGTADLRFSLTLDNAITHGLTDEGRKLCGVELPSSLSPDAEAELQQRLLELREQLQGES